MRTARVRLVRSTTGPRASRSSPYSATVSGADEAFDLQDRGSGSAVHQRAVAASARSTRPTDACWWYPIGAVGPDSCRSAVFDVSYRHASCSDYTVISACRLMWTEAFAVLLV